MKPTLEESVFMENDRRRKIIVIHVIAGLVIFIAFCYLSAQLWVTFHHLV